MQSAIFVIVRGLRFLLLCSITALARDADEPIWAKGATPLRGIETRAPQRIISSDGNVVLEVRRRARTGDDDVLSIHVVTPKGRWQDADLDEGAHELLWAPDSSAFLVNGSTSGYAGFFTMVYQFGSDRLRKLNVTKTAQRDMVASFPPCKALNRDEARCKDIAKNPEFNMSGLSWIGSSQIAVIAEVPCSSSYGGIMCQVQGYILSVPAGSIIERLTAREVKARWQRSMAWRMQIPDPPSYGPALKMDPGGR